MDSKMFCFQCEQTAGGVGCKGSSGVCGKKHDIAGLQDKLTGALIGLARTTDGDTHPTENIWASRTSASARRCPHSYPPTY